MTSSWQAVNYHRLYNASSSVWEGLAAHKPASGTHAQSEYARTHALTKLGTERLTLYWSALANCKGNRENGVRRYTHSWCGPLVLLPDQLFWGGEEEKEALGREWKSVQLQVVHVRTTIAFSPSPSMLINFPLKATRDAWHLGKVIWEEKRRGFELIVHTDCQYRPFSIYTMKRAAVLTVCRLRTHSPRQLQTHSPCAEPTRRRTHHRERHCTEKIEKRQVNMSRPIFADLHTRRENFTLSIPTNWVHAIRTNASPIELKQVHTTRRHSLLYLSLRVAIEHFTIQDGRFWKLRHCHSALRRSFPPRFCGDQVNVSCNCAPHSQQSTWDFLFSFPWSDLGQNDCLNPVRQTSPMGCARCSESWLDCSKSCSLDFVRSAPVPYVGLSWKV